MGWFAKPVNLFVILFVFYLGNDKILHMNNSTDRYRGHSIIINLFAVALIVYILIVGKNILLPVVTSIVIWYLIIRLAAAFAKIPVLDIKVPSLISILLAVVVTCFVLYGFGALVTRSVNNIIQEVPEYQARLNELLMFVNKWTHSELNFSELINRINLGSLFSHVTLTITYLAGNLMLIVIYVLFLLMEYKTFDSKLKAMCRTTTQYNNMNNMISRISNDINTYMRVKTLMSLLTGILSYFVLISFGISNAAFWSLLIFLLNYIPTVGSIIAIVFTLLVVSVHFTHISLFIIMAILLIAIQILVGSLIEPKYMGKNLNLSPILILIALAFWGSVWGILGMFLCVPLMTILNIILANFESTRNIAVFFSANPDVVR